MGVAVAVENLSKKYLIGHQPRERYTALRDVLLGHLPSLSACIIDGNEVIWSKGYGFYDLENRKPATDNTIYNIASISKTVTGTALMQLWEQDLFDLDEDVNNFLPFNLRNPNFPDIPITFRMLLSHSSSLNPGNWNFRI